MQRSATLAFWGILAFGLYSLGSALQPLLISFAIAYLVFPLVKRLEKRGIRRQAAVLSVLVGTTLFWIIVGLLVVPGVLQEGREFLQQLPQNAHRSIEKIEALASSLGFEQSINKETIQAYLATHMTELSGSLAQRISQGLQGLFTNLLSGFLFFLNLMLVPIFFFHGDDFQQYSYVLGPYSIVFSHVTNIQLIFSFRKSRNEK